LHSYPGGWPEYVRVREARAEAADTAGAGAAGGQVAAAQRANGVSAAPAAPPQRPSAAGNRNHRKGPSKTRLAAQAEAERAIEDAEAALRALEDELADPAAWATRYEAAKSEARHTAARRAVEQAYARLEMLID